MQQNPKHIIIIEDDELHVLLLERSLRRINSLHVEVKQAANGREGIDEIEGHFSATDAAPLLVFLDIKMPIMNGFKVMEYINQKPYRSKINMIILTTSNMAEDLARAEKLGYDHYMVKPISYQALIPLVENL